MGEVKGMSKWNYFIELTVDGYSFPTNPQINFGFNSQGFSFLNYSDYVLEYSFDGSTLHGNLDPGNASKGITFDFRVESKVWFRAISGYGNVRVEAWGGYGRS
jgi:hypothetical protein